MNPIFPGASQPPQAPRFGEARVTKTASGHSLYMILDRIHPVSETRGVVLYFHGNGEVVEDLAYLLPVFRASKLHLVLVEYPGYGNAPGSPSEKEIRRTAIEAYDWARKEFPDLPVIAAGWSLGSSVAAFLASEREVKHVLMLSAMTSMKEVVLNLMPFVPTLLLKGNEFETTQILSKIKAPVTLIHGDKDDLVPIAMGRELQKRLGDKSRLVVIPGASHNDFFFLGAKEIQSEVARAVEGK